MKNKDFTHLTPEGVHMVEVGDKPSLKRSAVASGKIFLKKKTIDLIENNALEKGNVLTTAQIAAINAVKATSSIIPLCHPLPVTGIEMSFEVLNDHIQVIVSVNSAGKTGVEMEALTGVSVGLLTIWDMVKSVEKDVDGQYPSTSIKDILVVEKTKEEIFSKSTIDYRHNGTGKTKEGN
ncbi:MAG: cyclic pyranopterin monophosphate synthase MoaC [Euryarchaeota archaeon]|nr:cyclic pyranopterin monophosphate synthase MoaC [Euryarchaeota archaeon]MBV1728975.1 cyclic pyranopterin monophosphate synthase MoaC [Methanobacterium sp.]MBU4548322.1 cyclic pyranopterin monophosphate synthase MoaC [Euryarchaeota archaeon]MBU4607929.1 cyclic pyranopterin monophosphate synthase MoaC [Euryarchaeota archaeon]MBV1754758.1 cyclic pyranopterin monophosphate synthase MoaC [Methanobacterium sp.]